MTTAKHLVLGFSLLAASAFAARADVNVVASIKPVHSLVSAVMAGVGEPGLIVQGGGSPHTYAMKPSQAAMLEKADLVFWIGQDLETFLVRPLKTIATKAKSVELIESDDLTKLDLREGGAFEAHDHENHKPQKVTGIRHGAKKPHHDHSHDRPKQANSKHDHGHQAFNAHVWLDPVNAKVIVSNIQSELSKADPGNAAKYEANARSAMARLDSLTTDIAAKLKPFKAKEFIVFHDAYHNFEHRFGLKAVGSITVSPEVMPGAKRIRRLRSKVRELGAICVFSEPQFEPKLVSTVVEGTSAKSGVLDPLGASLQGGSELYFTLLKNMAAAYANCFSRSDRG